MVSADRQYTAKEYEVEARRVIGEILARKRVPIVVGGTGLYVRALLSGIFEGPSRNEALRARLAARAAREGPEALWRRLVEADREKARQIAPTNLARIIRALEVFELTGKPMSLLEKTARPIGLPHVKVGLRRERPDLHARIDRRVDQMMELGFLEEVRALRGRGFGESPVVRSSLGYKEALLHLEGRIPVEEAVRLIKQGTRNFAKRQMTWFARETDLAWMDLTGTVTYEAAADEISRSYTLRAAGGGCAGPSP
jgi:tRNA dimethylallyltransferase